MTKYAIKLLSKSDIARRAMISRPSVNYIFQGERHISWKMFETLEDVTGVAREARMWPDRWYNPYVSGAKASLPDLIECREHYLKTKKQ